MTTHLHLKQQAIILLQFNLAEINTSNRDSVYSSAFLEIQLVPYSGTSQQSTKTVKKRAIQKKKRRCLTMIVVYLTEQITASSVSLMRGGGRGRRCTNPQPPVEGYRLENRIINTWQKNVYK